MKISNLESLRQAHPKLRVELAALFEKYGCELVDSRAKIGDHQLEFKIQLRYGEKEELSQKAEDEYRLIANRYDLPLDGLNKKYMINGEVFQIVGVNINKPKNCIRLVREKDNKSFQCPAQTIRTAKMVA